MSGAGDSPDELPVLTERVDGDGDIRGTMDDDPVAGAAIDDRLAALQAAISSDALALAERLLHSAFTEMEATLFEQVSNRLRQELPELVDRVLREHLADSRLPGPASSGTTPPTDTGKPK